MSKQNFRRGNKELIGEKRRWKINLETGWSISPAAVATHPVFIQRRERHLDEIQTNHSTFLELVDGLLQSRTPLICP